MNYQLINFNSQILQDFKSAQSLWLKGANQQKMEQKDILCSKKSKKKKNKLKVMKLVAQTYFKNNKFTTVNTLRV